MTQAKRFLAALLIAAGASALAGKNSERFAERMKMRQQRLHDALKLTAAQEPAWNKFQASHPFADPAQRPSPTDLSSLKAPERADKMLELQKQHQEAMNRHVAALKEFYAQLTPEQQKIFDEQQQRRPHDPRGERGPR